jgi:DNA gyrase subunit A
VTEVGVIRQVNIEEEMKSSYLDYAMSVIISRALPDVRDGLKPVQRRILYSMHELGVRHNSSFKKSARIVGEVMGKYHPHGDAPVYEAMVRLAQDFSMRYTLVDGQGNFGSVDNDPPAAMRYTEARLSAIAEEMLVDIDKETVDFTPNFDNSLQEPLVLPAKLPNLLVNGSAGIAVGMATSIPPHNLSEVCEAIVHVIENPEATFDELMQFVKGPDFPTGAIIMGMEGIRQAYATGQGKVVVRARVEEAEARGGRTQIIISELPYQVDKAALVRRIAELAKDKKIEGISEVRDESDREGMRVVIDLKRDGQAGVVLNNLYKHTPMQSAFYINMVALVNGAPRLLNLKETLTNYIDFRKEIITRRSKFDLGKAKERAHILEGFRIAIDNLDEVIATIRRSETVESARNNLMKNFKLSQVQAQAILDMQLRRLAKMEQNKIAEEYAEVIKTIAYLEDLLANPRKVLSLISQETNELKKKYGDKRRTEISQNEAVEQTIEELIPHQRVVITMSNQDYIKRVPLASFRLQHKGGKGVTGMVAREADVVRHIVMADTHDSLLLFTDRGRVYRLKAYQVPQDQTRATKGTALVNLLGIDLKEHVTAIIAVSSFTAGMYLFMATAKGTVKRTPLEDFASVRSNGLIAIKLRPQDELVEATKATSEDEVIMVTREGKGIRFAVSNVRPISRTAAGVRGIRLQPGDRVVGMDVIRPDTYVLTITEHGFGKLTLAGIYRVIRRGGQGVIAHKLTPKTGKIVAMQQATKESQLTIASVGGMVIRTNVDGIRAIKRGTQGVHVMRIDAGDRVSAIACQENDGSPEPEKDK